MYILAVWMLVGPNGWETNTLPVPESQKLGTLGPRDGCTYDYPSTLKQPSGFISEKHWPPSKFDVTVQVDGIEFESQTRGLRSQWGMPSIQ